MRDFLVSDVSARPALAAQGAQLVSARQEEMAALIRTNPEEAIRRSLPYSVRKQLPPEIASQIEQPVSGRGSFRPLYYVPLPGRESEVPPTGYEVTMNGTDYETHAYGDRLHHPARDGAYLHGVSVKERAKTKPLLALSDEAHRLITDRGEARDLVSTGQLQADALCGVTKKPASSDQPVISQYGEHYYAFCEPAHAKQLNATLKRASAVSWALGGAGKVSGPNATNVQFEGFSRTQGRKKLLYIRVLFADDINPPQTDDQAQATVLANNRYFHEGSYGTVWWESTVTPLIRLPQRKNYYGENEGALLGDARNGAAALGYFPGDYFGPSYVLCTSMPQYLYGGISSGVLNGSPGAITHELGHNFNLPHANFWQPEGSLPGPVQPQNLSPWPIDPDALNGHNDINAPYIIGLGGAQPSQEYGNPRDVMGSGPGHFSAVAKRYMDWLPQDFVKTVTVSTTNRLYAFDTPRIDRGRLYAMQIRKDVTREYWLSYRQGFAANPWFSNGLEVEWNLGGENVDETFIMFGNELIDTTPDTSYGKEDAALIVGRTLSDPAASLHITPIARGGGPVSSDKWIDVVVMKGSFPGNQIPTMTLEASALTVAQGAIVDFTVIAQDADGDALAYNWDFGDWTFGTNGPVQSKTFNANGQYVVRCEVSDMKGGRASRQLVLTVGSPTTYTISGRVLDTEGNPVEGVRIHNNGVRPVNPPADPYAPYTNAPVDVGTYRYGYTDTDGFYVIGNVPDGTYVVRAFKYGYSTMPLDFTDPVNVNGNASGLNFTATKLARVSVAWTADATEPGDEYDPAEDGVFTITREGGEFSQDLPVVFTMSGRALYDFDYGLAGTDNLATNCVYETNGTVITTNCVVFTTPRGQLIIPAFQSSIDVHVIPTNNFLGDGAKSAVMTLILQTNFTRVTTVLTNFLVTNQPGNIVVTNSLFVQRTNQFRVPGWELRPFGPSGTPTWFQTDPTYVLDQAEATVNILDDDEPDPPTVSVFTLDFDAHEARGDSAMMAIVRQGAPLDQDLVVHYETPDVSAFYSPALNGEDVALLSGTITIPAGQSFALLPVVAINDLFVEGNEILFVNILESPEYFTGFADGMIVVDDDLPQVNIFTSVSTVARNGGSARVTLSRVGSVDEDLTVNYLVTGTAVSGVDFTTLSGSVVLPAGQLSVDVNINPIPTSTNPLPRTVTIVISDSTTYNIYQQNSATVTIIDQNLPTVTLARSGDTISENGGTSTFTVTRTGAITNNLNVFFDTGGSAWEGSDYASVGTNIIIPAGSITAGIVITAINDSAREFGDTWGDDTVIVRLRANTNYTLGGTVSQTIRIVDDEGDTALPSVGFMLQRSSVFENAGQARIFVKVTANPATNRPIEIEYRVTAGSATPNVNYVNSFPDRRDPTGQSVTGILNITHYFPPNPPPRFYDLENGIYTIPVTVLDDLVASGDKTVTITLFNPTGYQTNRSLVTNGGIIYTNFLITHLPTNAFLGPASSHTLTIQDLKTSTVTLAATAERTYEAGPVPGQFIFTRDGATNVPLTVYFALEGTAASGSDYVPVGTNITIPVGTNSVALTLMPIDDPTEEVAETMIIRLLPRSGYHSALGAGAGMIIVSDDGTIQFGAAEYNFSENAGFAVVPVVRTGGTNLAGTVDYLITGGTATNGVDYLGTNGTLSFLPGEDVKSIILPLVNESLVEPDETILLVLTNATGGVPLGGQRTTTVNIVNDDTAFDFAVAAFRANENAGLGTVIVTRTGVLTNTDTVWVTITNLIPPTVGIAGPLDFVPAAHLLTFNPGETNRPVSLTLLDDELFEGDENISLRLSQPSGSLQLGALSNAVLVIVDDECRLDFEVTGYSVKEYSNFVTLVVRRVGGTVNPVTALYTTGDGTATNGFDFAGVTNTVSFLGDQLVADTNGSGQVTFVPGESFRTINITILDDVIGEGNENFHISLSDPASPSPASLPGATLLGVNLTTEVTILDNETPGNVDYEFVAGPNATVNSVALAPDLKVAIGGEFTLLDGFSFNRIARLHADGARDAGFNPGAGANSNVHVVAVQPDGKVLAGGEFTTMDTSNRVRLARLNADGNVDSGFVVPTNGVNGIVRAIAVQTNGQIVIAGDFTQVSGVARSHIARLNANGTLDGSFSPSLSGNGLALAIQADGKIVVGGAFSAVNGLPQNNLARLNAGGSLDGAFLIGSGCNGAVNGLAVQANGRIVVAGAFTLVNGVNREYLVRLETGGNLDGTFLTGGGPNSAVSAVAVHGSGKILIAGDFISYDGRPANRFARLKSNGSFDPVFVTGTGANALVRSVVVQPDSAVIIGGEFTEVNGIARSYVARIHGDERSSIPTVDFGAANFTVDETAVSAVIPVVRSGSTNQAFVIQYWSTNGTATAGQDYTGVTNTLVFAAGQLTNSFAILIQDDLLIEGDETVNLSLTNVTPNVDVSGQSTAVLTILDNERFVQFSATNYVIREDSNTVAITLTRTGGLSGVITVLLTTSNGTALAGSDYFSFSNTVTFAAGQITATASIALVNDLVGEAAERFHLSLSTPTGGLLGTPASATVTILDDDINFGTFNYTNPNAIVILDAAPAAPYPSSISVSNLTGVVSRVVVSLVGFTHTFPSDVDVLLVGPQGQKTLLMSDSGGSGDVFGLNLRFEDSAASLLSDTALLVASTNHPTDYAPVDGFAAPAPAGPYATELAVFNGTVGNGTWSLYVVDDRGNDSGVISNGWRMTITTVDAASASDLGLTMTDAPDPVAAGDTLIYALFVTNRGPLGVTGVQLTNYLSPNVEFISAVALQGTCTNLNGVVACGLLDLPAGGSDYVWISVRPLVQGTVTNRAVVSANEPDVITTNNSATVITTVTPGTTADLRVTLTDAPDPVFAGQNVTYHFTVTNRGPITATGLLITNRFPENGSLVSASSTAGSIINSGTELIINVGTLLNGAGLMGDVVVLSRFGGTMTNTIAARAAQPDFSPANTATEITEVIPAADLAVFMSDSRDPVGPGANVIYTVTVVNNGPNHAHNVTLFDTLPIPFNVVSFTNSQGTSYDAAGVLVFEFGTVSNGASASATIIVQTIATGIYTNLATAVAQEGDISPANNTAVESTTVQGGGGTVTASGIIDNGTIQLGVNPAADLNVRNGPPSLGGTTSVGLRYLPTGAESTAPGCLCEGWGVANGLSGAAGGANEASDGGAFGLVVESFVADGVTARSVVRVHGSSVFGGVDTGTPATFRVTHYYHPSAATTNLYQVDVTIENISTNVVEVLYRRVMDWDIEPTPFNEYSTIIKGDSTNLVFTSDNGFASGNPQVGPSQILAVGTFIDSGPADHGALFDFNFGQLNPGQSKSFVTYYGAAGTERDAVTAIARVGTEAYSFGQSSTPGGKTNGTPNTFIFGFGGIGGSALAGSDLAVDVSTPSALVSAGSVFNYTVVVTNPGPDIATAVFLTNTFLSPAVNITAVTPSQGVLALSSNSLVLNIGDMPPRTIVTLNLSVIATAEGFLTNRADVTTTQIDFNTSNNTDENVVTVVSPGTYANPNPITIYDAGPALPYPSIIRVSNAPPRVTAVTATLLDINHTYPADLDVLLVGPQGQKVLLMSDAGGGYDLNGVTLKFDDEAGLFLPAAAQIVAGSYKPSNVGGGDFFFSPAPPPPYAAFMSSFNGTDPNGDWSLYILDDQGSDVGLVGSGWRMSFVFNVALRIERLGSSVVLSWPSSETGYTLESAPAPTGPWGVVTSAPPLVGGRFTVIVPAGGANQLYFRLRKP